MNRFLTSSRHLLTGLSLALLLWGCAHVGDVEMVDSLDEDTELTAEQGVVTAKVIDASGNKLPFNYMTIIPRDLFESRDIKPLRLKAVDKEKDSPTLFASALPPGDYTVSSLRAYHTQGTSRYSRWATGDIELGTFTVDAGGVTDLGKLVYYPRVQGERYADSIIRIPGSQAIQSAQKFVQQEALEATSARGWNDDQSHTDQHLLYLSAVQNPTWFNGRRKAPNGSLYFYGKLGSIVVRNADGSWSMDAVEADSDMHSMDVNELGDQAIGGDLGKLYYKQSGSEWQSLALDPKLRVQEIRFRDNNTFDVIASTGTELTVFRYTVENHTPIEKEIARYNSRDGWVSHNGRKPGVGAAERPQRALRRIGQVSTHYLGGDYYLLMNSQLGGSRDRSSRYRFETFSLQPETWEVSKPEGRVGVERIVDGGPVQIGLREPDYFSPRKVPLYFRYDETSQDWERIRRRMDNCPGASSGVRNCRSGDEVVWRFEGFEFVSLPVFTSADEAIAVARYTPADSEEPVSLLLATQNGGESWNRTEREVPKPYCTSAVSEITDTLLMYCNGATSDVYQSDDQGATWQRVREHQNF